MVTASAPWLLFGFFLAGILHEFLPAQMIEKYLKAPGWRSIIRASAVGVPLPLCSCSVIPVAISLRRRGASRGATASFLVSTPEIGVDSFILSYFLLNPFFAFYRAACAFVSAMLAGFSIDYLTKELSPPQHVTLDSSCCSSSNFPQQTSTNHRLVKRLRRILRYGFIDLLNDVSRPLLVGLIVSGVISAYLPNDYFHTLGLSPLASMFLMLSVSLPTYVCATASTTLAAALLAKGLNPGAALVFLLAGPASNVSTMMVVGTELGKRALFAYIASISIVALGAGWMLDQLSLEFDLSTVSPFVSHHEHEGGIFPLVSGIILLLLLLYSVSQKYLPGKQNPSHP